MFIFLVFSDNQVKKIRINNSKIEEFFLQEKAGFQDDHISIALEKSTLEKIGEMGGKVDEMKAIHFFSLVVLSGKRERSDIYEFSRKFLSFFSVSSYILLC
jgi:hypothetical protein